MAESEHNDTVAVPAEIAAEWLQPFLDFLANERRYSPYTVRNYRQAFEGFYRWLRTLKGDAGDFGTLDARDVRDFVIESQRR